MIEEFLPAGIRGGSVEEVVDDGIGVNSKFALHLRKFVFCRGNTRPREGGFDSSDPYLDVEFVKGGKVDFSWNQTEIGGLHGWG